MATTIKVGMVFQHRNWFDAMPGSASREPLVCIVTAIRHGMVYYKSARWDGRTWVADGGKWYQDLATFEQKRVLRWVE